MTPEIIQSLGDELYIAQRNRMMVEPLTNRHPELSIEEVYGIQQRMISRRLQNGERVVGKKIGVTSQAVMDMLGVYQPDFGYMLDGIIVSDGDSIAAMECGANRIDAACAGLGAGAGNTPMEVFIAVCDRMGIETGVDVWKIQDVAEDLVVPIMDFPIRIDRDALTLGYAGVYGSFLLFAKRAEKKYGVPARDILVELGRRGMVGGQEDMIEDTAMTLTKARGQASAKVA